MQAGVATVFSVDSRLPGAEIHRLVGMLMQRSRSTVVLNKGKAMRVAAVDQIAGVVQDWPHWSSLPWVVGGRLDPAEIPSLGVDELVMREFKPIDFDLQVAKLLEHFDWGVFSYFTSFHDAIYTVVARQSELCSCIVAMLPQGAIMSSVSGPTFANKLNNATYYDHGEPGWLAYELASTLDEGLPLLLTRMEGNGADMYYRWNSETDSREDFIWYEEPLAQLERMDAFDVGQTHYQVHRASDLEAYLQLWSMASHEWGIADATLSARTDLEGLRSVIAERRQFDIIRSAGLVAPWAYGQIYGGGSDEHHAIFHARDAAVTQRIWQWADERAISRF